MIHYQLVINQSDVFAEVSKLSEYTGSKIVDEQGRDEREAVWATPLDLKSLTHLWQEAQSALETALQDFASGDGLLDGQGNYTLHLRFSERTAYFGIQKLAHSYFVRSIVGRWFSIACKPEAEASLMAAGQTLKEMVRKLYTLKAPALQ